MVFWSAAHRPAELKRETFYETEKLDEFVKKSFYHHWDHREYLILLTIYLCALRGLCGKFDFLRDRKI